MNRKRTIQFAVVVLAALALPAYALLEKAEVGKSGPKALRQKPPVSRADRTRRASAPQRADLEKPLGQTLRLTFILKNEDGEHSFPVACAGESYLIDHDVSETGGSHQIKFEGRVRMIEQSQRLFVSFDALQFHSNNVEGVDASFKLHGSVLVRPGQKVDIGRLGDSQVFLNVTPLQ